MNFNNPRFYIKSVGGEFSLYHRFTHSFIESHKEVEDLAESLAEWNEVSQEDLWDYLFEQMRATLVKPMDYDKRFGDEERNFNGAWLMYTEVFYSERPHLYVDEPELPYGVASSVKMTRSKREHELSKQREAERVRALEEYENRQRELATERKESEREESERKEEERKHKERNERKARSVVIRRKKGNTLACPTVSDNPFD